MRPPSYDPRPDSQRSGGKPEKKTIIPLPRPNVQIPLVAYTSGDIHKAREIENRYQDLIQDHLLPDDIDYAEAQAAFERADVQRLSNEQILRIDYLLSTEDDPLVRSMLLAVKHEGIPGHLSFDEYMGRFADWGLVEESDQRAWQVMQSNIKDLTNDNYESARAIDLNSGEEVFLRAGSKDSVLLQDEHKRMLEGRDIALIHNHPNNSPASDDDLTAALDLGVMFLVLVTPSGLQYHYRRYGNEMKLVEVIHNPDYVALPSAQEDEESRAAYEAQALAEAVDPADYVFHEDEPPVEIQFEGSLKASTLHEQVVLDQNETFQFNRQTKFEVLGRSHFNFYVVLVETEFGNQLWLDLRDNPEFMALDADIANLEIAEESNQPFPTSEEVKRSFAMNPLGQVDIFPVAQDPRETEIIQLAVRNPTLYPTMVDYRHPGIDFFAPAGTDVISLTSGEVVGIYIPGQTDFDYDTYGSEVESLENSGMVLDPRQLALDGSVENTHIRRRIASGWLAEGGEGAYIIVRTGNTYFLYAHLDPSSIEVGTHVMEGQTIGSIGKSKEGPAGEHLHLETRIHVTGTVDLDGTTGDYSDSRDKPLIIVNPARYFTGDLVNAINRGLALRNRNVQQRGRFEQGNASPDALNQNTQVIDEGADQLYVYNRRRGFEHLERQFDPSATWLHRTEVILSE